MQDIRNIAVIAHVDHGKTTLVDKMMLAGKLFRDGQDNSGEVLDSNDLERERGITILSKNVSINWKGTKINILDTPGHSDFGGEVERVLNMADGCLLLVDAFEGPMPQTRFVLQKALQLGLKPIVVVNKVDKPNCRPEEVYEMVFDLMCDLDKIVEIIPAPKQLEGTPQLLITSLDYSSYTGRIAVGRVHRGTLKDGMNVTICHRDGTQEKTKIKELHTFEGMGHKKTDHVDSGDICAVVGLEKFEIGDTICDYENPEPLPPIAVDEPTMSMLFTINDSPFFGKEGKFCTSRHIQDRLNKELEKNLALRVQPYEDTTDKWIVSGRGVIDPGEEVYGGEVVGEHVHDNDLVVNVTKAKQLTNVRASGSDDKARVIPKTVMSLEECLEYIREDEYVEVTPKSMRMRKVILDHLERKRSNKE